MNLKRVAYWVCTGLVVFFIGSGGLAYVVQVPEVVQGVVALGFPVHFVSAARRLEGLGLHRDRGAPVFADQGVGVRRDHDRPDRRRVHVDRDRCRVVACRRAAVDRVARDSVVGIAA
jgi:hypothetical protein